MKVFFAFFVFVLFVYSCTSVDYNNPLDRKSPNFLGDDYVGDDNNDGIPNFRDPTSTFYLGERDTTPSDTIQHRLIVNFYASNDTFNMSESVPFFVSVQSSAGVDRISYDFTGDGQEDTEFIFVNDSLVRFVYTETGLFNAIATVFDTRGMSASDTFAIRIRDRASEIDTIPPVITLLGSDTVSIALGEAFVEPSFTVTDNRDSIPLSFVNVNRTQLNLNAVGIYAVVYTVSDLSGNVGTATRYVRVSQRQVIITPVITLLGSTDTSLMQNALWMEPGFTIEDESDPRVVFSVTISFVNIQGDTVDNNFTQNPGIYVIYYNAINASGVRAETRARNVTVRTVSSVPTSASSQPASVASSVPPIVSSVSSPISSQAVSSVPSGVDAIRPIVTLVGNVTMQHIIGSPWIDPGATAMDNVDGNISEFIERVIFRSTDIQRANPMATNLFLNTEGTYIIVYSVSDAAGNIGEAVRNVRVGTSATSIPTVSSAASVSSAPSSVGTGTPPEILLLQANRNPDTITVGTLQVYNDPGAMAFDGSVDITAQIVVTSNVNLDVIGVYQVTYSVTNSAGLTSTATRTVVVTAYIDRIPPVITLTGPVLLRLRAGEPFVEPGFTVSDNIDANMADRVVVTAINSLGVEIPFSTFTQNAGTYRVHYNVSDMAGNNAQERIRDVIVTSGIEITQWGVDVLIPETEAIIMQVAPPPHTPGRTTGIFRCERVNTGLNMAIAGSLVIGTQTFSLDGWSPAPTDVPLNGTGTITVNQPVNCRIGY